MLPSMHPAPARPAPSLVLAGCLLFVFAGTAIASPWVYLAGHGVLPYPFHRYVDRVLMLAALAGLFLFWRGLRLGSWRQIGVADWRRGKWDLAVGAMLGLGSSALFLTAAFVAGGRTLHGALPAGWFLGTVAGAAVLACLEELLFRGVLQTVLVRDFGPAPGIAAGALLFAVLHFIKVPPGFAPAPVTWASGFEAVGLAFAPLGGVGWLGPRFALLAGVGLVLGLAAWRTGRLWLPVGLHAGWIVLGLKVGNKTTEGVPGHWAGADFSANPLSFAILAVVALAVWKWPTSPTP